MGRARQYFFCFIYLFTNYMDDLMYQHRKFEATEIAQVSQISTVFLEQASELTESVKFDFSFIKTNNVYCFGITNKYCNKNLLDFIGLLKVLIRSNYLEEIIFLKNKYESQ